MSVEPHARAALQTIVKHMTVDGGPVAAAVATLATIVEQLLPPEVPPVQCPACQQTVIPGPDGTLPGHDIAPGPRRSPRCRFRGSLEQHAQTLDALERGASADLLGDLYAEDLAHEIPADAEQFVLAVQQPGGGAS